MAQGGKKLKGVFMETITLLGFIAASLTTFAVLPQVVKTIKTKETKNLSLGMFVVATIGFALWCAYGILRQDIVLITANAITFSLWLTMIILKIKHG